MSRSPDPGTQLPRSLGKGAEGRGGCPRPVAETVSEAETPAGGWGGQWPRLWPRRECERLRLWRPLGSPRARRPSFPSAFPRPPRNVDRKPKDKKEKKKRRKKKENHEGEKNGCRGLRNPQALPTLLPLLRPERHTTVDCPFPYRLPSAADTSAWISGLSGSRTLREKPAKQDQTLGGGRGLNKSGSWWPTGGVTRFPFCFMFCIQHI